MNLEQTVAEALRESGDVGAALTWSQVLEELAGGLRIAVTCGQGESGPRWRAALPELPGLDWIWVEPEVDGVGLGGQFRVLGAHGLVFLTPITSPLGQHDRNQLEALDACAPRARGVVLADEALLERLSDHPDEERSAVVARVQGLLPDSWTALDHAALETWGETLRNNPDLRENRRREIAGFLLADRIERELRTQERSEDALQAVQEQLAGADAELEALQQRARRWAAHTLAILRRQTSLLGLDLAEFLRSVEADLPAQVHSIEDITLLRKTLPHWLSHVVESWLDDRVAQWRLQVLAELQELELEEPINARLVVPALQPGNLKGETRWAQRLGTTAAFGGAAALLALGLWIPSLLAIAGGLAWNTASRGSSEPEERRSLLASGREALRQMGDDAERLLADQLDALEQDLKELETDGDDPEVSELRYRLETEAGDLMHRLDTMDGTIARLRAVLEEVT